MGDLNEIGRDDSRVWYAVQTFFCKEESVGEFLKKKELPFFIPMRYVEHETLEGKKSRKLVPAIHNLLFLEKTIPDPQLLEKTADCPHPFRILRNRDTGGFYEIRDSEMTELRAISDPEYDGTLYVDIETAEARPGQQVRVIRGPFTGMVGKLTRYKNRSYVVITAATLGVMVHIPKWYCEKVV